MKRILSALLAISLLTCASTTAIAAYTQNTEPQATLIQADTVANIFPDTFLAQVVAEHLGISVETSVTQASLDNILWLDHGRLPDNPQSERIQSLQGIQFLPNLTWLDLSHNHISDLQPLSGLTKLTVLNLRFNQIHDLNPLAELFSLTWLSLERNLISDISPLADLSNLSSLNLSGQTAVHSTYPPIPWTSSLSIPATRVQDESGARIPLLISNNGTYHNGMITWTDLVPAQAGKPETLFVSYHWSQPVQIGNASTWFEGYRTMRFLPFHDLSQDDWFSYYVWAAAHNGWVLGTSETTFSPHDPITRAAAVTILHRIAGEPTTAFQPIFDDVLEAQWHSTAIIWAHSVGLVHGMGDGRFAPDDPITGEQLVTMMLRFVPVFGLREPTIPEGAVVPEFEASSWAYEAMRIAVFYELITTENPIHPINRAETVSYVVRFIGAFFIG